jgi:hypothetical protein
VDMMLFLIEKYLNNNIERHVSLINNELIRICQLLIIILQFIFLELKIAKNHKEVICILSNIEQHLLVNIFFKIKLTN